MPDPVRPATAADAATLGRLLWDFNTEFDTPTDDAEVLSERFTRLLGLDGVLAFLAEGACGPTGFAFLTLRPAIWFDGPVAQLEELYVVPALRGQGIGTALLTTTRQVVQARRAPEMHINVDEDDLDTRRFYERHGFVNIEPGADERMLCYIGQTSP